MRASGERAAWVTLALLLIIVCGAAAGVSLRRLALSSGRWLDVSLLPSGAASLAPERAAAAASDGSQAASGRHGAAPGVPRALLSCRRLLAPQLPQGSLLAEIFATSFAVAQIRPLGASFRSVSA